MWSSVFGFLCIVALVHASPGPTTTYVRVDYYTAADCNGIIAFTEYFPTTTCVVISGTPDVPVAYGRFSGGSSTTIVYSNYTAINCQGPVTLQPTIPLSTCIPPIRRPLSSIHFPTYHAIFTTTSSYWPPDSPTPSLSFNMQYNGFSCGSTYTRQVLSLGTCFTTNSGSSFRVSYCNENGYTILDYTDAQCSNFFLEATFPFESTCVSSALSTLTRGECNTPALNLPVQYAQTIFFVDDCSFDCPSHRCVVFYETTLLDQCAPYSPLISNHTYQFKNELTSSYSTKIFPTKDCSGSVQHTNVTNKETCEFSNYYLHSTNTVTQPSPYIIPGYSQLSIQVRLSCTSPLVLYTLTLLPGTCVPPGYLSMSPGTLNFCNDNQYSYTTFEGQNNCAGNEHTVVGTSNTCNFVPELGYAVTYSCEHGVTNSTQQYILTSDYISLRVLNAPTSGSPPFPPQFDPGHRRPFLSASGSTATAAQKWRFVPQGSPDTVNVVSVLTGLCLDGNINVPQYQTTNTPFMWACDGSSNHLWRFLPSDSYAGYVALQNVATGLVLDCSTQFVPQYNSSYPVPYFVQTEVNDDRHLWRLIRTN